ncbi:MAG: hypothetical protein IKE74_06150 [Mogibacterium sp.]|nr:hypothetical protein [Mogibacterium sp.]
MGHENRDNRKISIVVQVALMLALVRRADKLMYENKWNIKGKVRGE